MSLFRKKSSFNVSSYRGGWNPSKTDNRDFKWSQTLGAITPELEELPERFSWRDKMPKELPSQLDIPSCVACSFALVQSFQQQQEWNKIIRLCWRFLWANSAHSKNGSDYRTMAKTLMKMGTASYKLCPDNPEKGYAWVEDRANISNEAATEALGHRINSYTFPDTFDIKRAISRGPIPIAVGGSNSEWNRDVVKANGNVVKYDSVKWYHSIVAVGWDGDRIEIANSFGKDWGDKGYAYLASGYPLNAAISLEDLVLNLTKVAKTEKSSAVFWIVNGWKHAVASAEVYMSIFHDPDWRMVKTITQEEMDSYYEGKKIVNKEFIIRLITNN